MFFVMTLAFWGAALGEPVRMPDGLRAPLVRSAANGRWSDAATWEGRNVPGSGARVQIRGGHVVTFDVKTDGTIRSIHVAGTLRFDRERDTRLDVGLIKIQAGDDASESGFDCENHAMASDTAGPRAALEIGTPDQPTTPLHGAIRLTAVEGLIPRMLSGSFANAAGGMFTVPLSRALGQATPAEKGSARVMENWVTNRQVWGIGSSSPPPRASACVTTSSFRASGSDPRPRNARSGRSMGSISTSTLPSLSRIRVSKPTRRSGQPQSQCHHRVRGPRRGSRPFEAVSSHPAGSPLRRVSSSRQTG